MSNYLIYKHAAPDGKAYIGQTCNLHRRNIVHRNTGGCRAFAAAIQKYGWESFTTTILAEGLTLDEANRLEMELIAEHGTIAPGGYNLRAGGDSKGVSQETRAKLSEKAKGRSISEAQRARLSELGKEMPPERIRLMVEKAAEARRIRAGEPHHNLGRKHSDEVRKRMSEGTKSALANPEVRAKISQARIGSRHSAETKAKISQAASRRWAKVRTKEGAA